MNTVGEYLRAQRKTSGVSLEQIASATRINVSQLRAIEEDDFSNLPGGVFTISFVKQYARAIGADEAEAVNLLKARHSFPAPEPFSNATERIKDPLLARGPMARIGEEISNFNASYGSVVASVAVGLLLIIGGLYSFEVWEQRRLDPDSRQIAEAPEQSQPDREIDQEPEPEPTAVLNTPRAAIRLELQIVEKVWIRAVADGERVLEGVFQPGDVRPILADNHVKMKVGNAGGVLLGFNGEAAIEIGPRGHVRSLEVTKQGVEILPPPPSPEAQRPSNAVRLPTTTAAIRWADLALSIPSTR